MPARLDTHPLGLTWTLDETMARSSHALADGGRVWLVDPVADPEALKAVAALGEPTAVIQLLDRHNRDGAALAARLGVPHLRLPDEIPDSPFIVVPVVDVPRWREHALWWPARRGLIVAEAVGTVAFDTLGAAPAGMHPFLRLLPPGALRDFEPEHLLPGHGPALHGAEAAAGLRAAYARSRRDLPRLALRLSRLLTRR